jgi:hypothetical protein
MNFLISTQLGAPDVKFRWKIETVVDPLTQAKVDETYTRAKVETPDEVRERRGLPAMTPEQRAAAWPKPIEPEAEPDGDEGDKEKTPEEQMTAAAEKLAKAIVPTVIELRPEVNVEVGDTIVQVPRA